MKILGISAYYHDSAAVIISDGKILAAAQEERFTRVKHDAGFPRNAVRFCLNYSGSSLEELDAVVFYDKPLLKFERLLETYYKNAPSGFISFLSAMPVWIKEKMFLRKILQEELKKIEPFKKQNLRILFTEHHLAHAASAFFPSGFQDAAILAVDGVGEWATASISHGSGNNITVLKELHFPHSVGMLYSAFTYFLGFKVNSGEYKLMGLSPYGNPDSEETQAFIQCIRENLVDIKDDGSIRLHMAWFNYETGLTMIKEKKWEHLFGINIRKPDEKILQHHCNLAYAIQQVTSEIILKMASTAKKLTSSENLCMAGGVALNCVTNGLLLRSGLFKKIFIQPAAGDAGGALGGALATFYMYFDAKRNNECLTVEDTMTGAYLGPEFSDLDTEYMAKKYKAVYTEYNDFDELAKETASLISSGNVVGWFQGRMEFGPRALGNRSILADARNPEIQKRLNLKIKYREGFRPFAPAVLAEDAGEYFDIDTSSPYMLLTANVTKKRRCPTPENYLNLPLLDKLYVLRSDIPAITHVDFSARLQTVHPETNKKFHTLILKFKEITGCSVVVNTSFNVRGEPIVCSPEDAYLCFMNTEMDYVVIGNYLFDKKSQPKQVGNKKNKVQINPD